MPDSDNDLLDLTLADAAAGLAQKRFSSLELTRACLRQIERYAPSLNCFTTVTERRALEQAHRADALLAGGDAPASPLLGIPLAEKDMFFRAGEQSSMGSRLGRHFTPRVTATVVERLDAAGAVSVGKLHMTEFAAGPTGQNEFLGFCRNPWNPAHISGGSSSGAGCAAAARMAYGTLGSDTGGSIRLPAGICGVVGVKTTFGRVSRHGAMPRCTSLDVFGPLARTAMDCALLLQAIEGRDARDPSTWVPFRPIAPYTLEAPLRGLRIGIADSSIATSASSEVQQALSTALDVLRGLGCEPVPVRLPATASIYALTQIVNKAEAAALHARWIAERGDEYGVSARSRMEAGFHIPAPLYLWALSARPRILESFVAAVFDNVDAVIMPLLDDEVPAIADVEMTASANVPAIVDRVTRHTRWVSYLGLPAVAVPCGMSAHGLPISFQLLGRPFSEPLLLRLAHGYQTQTPWHRRAPPLSSSPRPDAPGGPHA